MGVRNIKKQLAGVEDLLLGVGTQVQERNSGNVLITKIDLVGLVDTVEDLATLDVTKYTAATVKDLNRGGTFIWSATGTANDGTVFAGATGYWNRQYDGAVNVKWFGAKGDGVTDDTIAIVATHSYCELSSREMYFPKTDGFYSVSSNININIPFKAGLYRIFGGVGDITLGNNSVSEVHPHWWGATSSDTLVIYSSIATINTAAFNSAFNQGKFVIIPSGNYQINGTITIKGSCSGNGTKTWFYPTSNITAFSIRSSVSCEVGLFSIHYLLAGTSSLNIGIHLGLGSTSIGDQLVACRVHNVYIYNCYRGVIYLSTDLGVAWNITLDTIETYNCSDYAIYFEADGSSSTLITIKNSGQIGSSTGKGIYAVNMSEVHIYDCYIDVGASAHGSLLYCFANNVDVDGFHVEGHTSTLSDSSSAPIVLRSSSGCVTAKNMYFAGWTFTPTSAVPVFFMRFEGKVSLGSVSEISTTVNSSATKYLANLLYTTEFNSTSHSEDSFFVAPATATFGKATASRNISVSNTSTTLLSTPLGGSYNVSQQTGLFIVNGVSTSDSAISFTDLILVTSNGKNNRTVVPISSNATSASTRTYSISSADINLSMATGTYIVSIKGITMARSRT